MLKHAFLMVLLIPSFSWAAFKCQGKTVKNGVVSEVFLNVRGVQKGVYNTVEVSVFEYLDGERRPADFNYRRTDRVVPRGAGCRGVEISIVAPLASGQVGITLPAFSPKGNFTATLSSESVSDLDIHLNCK